MKVRSRLLSMIFAGVLSCSSICMITSGDVEIIMDMDCSSEAADVCDDHSIMSDEIEIASPVDEAAITLSENRDDESLSAGYESDTFSADKEYETMFAEMDDAVFADGSDVSILVDGEDTTSAFEETESISEEVVEDVAELPEEDGDMALSDSDEDLLLAGKSDKDTYKCGDNALLRVDNNGVMFLEGTGIVGNHDGYPEKEFSNNHDIDSVVSLIIGEGITEIESDFFLYYGNIELIQFPSTLTKVGNGAFSTYSLKTITVAEGNPVFYSEEGILTDKSMNNLYFCPDGAAKCGPGVYQEFTADGTLRIYGSGNMWDFDNDNSDRDYVISTWNQQPWRGATDKITTVVIEEGVTDISQYAFADCKNIKTIYVPSTVGAIGESAFPRGDALESITVNEGNTHYYSTDGVLYTIDGDMIFRPTMSKKCGDNATWSIVDKTLYISGTGSTWDYDVLIPGMREKDKYSWDGYAVNEIVIGEGITRIGDNIFTYSKSVEKISIPSSVTEIGEEAFPRRESLKELIVDSNNPMFYSKDGVLYKREGNESVFIPVKSVKCGDDIFWSLDDNGVLHLSGTGEMFDYEPDVVYPGKYFCLQLTPWDEEKVTSIEIGNGITKIGEYAFYECKNAVSIRLPKTLIGITASETIPLAYSDRLVVADNYNCPRSALPSEKLATIIVESGNPVYSDDNGVLMDKDKTTVLCCPSAKTGICRIPSTVKKIGDSAFYDTHLNELHIPASVRVLGDGYEVVHYLYNYWHGFHVWGDGTLKIFLYGDAPDGKLFGAGKIDVVYIPYGNKTYTKQALKTLGLRGMVDSSYMGGKVGRLAYWDPATGKIISTKNQPMTVKAKTVTVKWAKLKKKKQTVAAKKAYQVKKAVGKVSFRKLSGNKKISVNTKSGKITIKKGLNKGTYKIKVKVTAAGDDIYKAGSKTVIVKIKIK